MTPQEFLDEFGTLAESAEGVPKLRELILELAVRGKLVEQDEAEEDVEFAVSRMRKETDRLVTNGTLKRPRETIDLDTVGRPFCLPAEWQWIQLADALRFGPRNGYSPKPVDYQTDVRSLALSATTFGRFDATKIKYIDEEVSPDSHLWLRPGDLLIQRSNSPEYVGVTVAYDGPSNQFIYPDLMMKFRVAEEVSSRFLELVMRCPFARTYFRTNATGTSGSMRKVNQSIVSAFPIPVPPPQEQHRIVSKVDELMGLCDRLEAVQSVRRGVHVRLNRSSLDRLTSVSTARGSGLSAAWQRVCDHFEVLYDTPETLPDLRQTILQLAVQGKLVPQDPNDEPAEELLPQIKEERNSEGHDPIKFTAKTYDEIATGSTFPDAWQLPALADVALTIVDCPHSTPKWTDAGMICVRTNQFSPGHLDLSNVRYVSDETYQERIQRLEPAHNDILYSREGGILGVACRVPEKTRLCLGQRMMLIRPPSKVDPAYLELVLNSPHITSVARHRTTGAAAPRVNVATVKAYPIPLPGLSEQKRIVSKVTHLLLQVTHLESTLTRRESTRTQLLTAAIHQMLTHESGNRNLNNGNN